MARATRTFRIFVSSTFGDFKEERNALQEWVFPRLRELCLQQGVRFQAIDLRWGVSEEASLDQQTMKICLEEIARCQKTTPRPNFIALLGDRYGWRPLPYEIPADEFEAIDQHVKDAQDWKLLHHWYWRDDNAVPPVYCLQPREEEYRDPKIWNPVEDTVRTILLDAIENLTLEPAHRMKYLTSATEQEIEKGVFRAPSPAESAFCFFRRIRGLPHHPDAGDFIDLNEGNRCDQEAQGRLHDLKQCLRERLPGNVHEYEAVWMSSGMSTDHIDQLCEDVYQSLSRIMLQQTARLEEVDPLEEEIADHEAFGQDRAKFFTGRAAVLEIISESVRGGNRHPLAVWGASGSGKSALMAKAVQQAQATHPKAEVIYHFIGATPDSSNGRALLENLCCQISCCYGVDESTIPTDYRQLVAEFPKRLSLATMEKPLIVFLDALDQLSDVDHARHLIWLPVDLPEHVRLIVSTLPGECLSALEKKLPQANLLELKPMSSEEGNTLLGLWLKDAGRTLQTHQREEVLSKFADYGWPLYLKLAFEEARLWKSYTEKTELSPDIPGISCDLLARLSSDANHGEMMVSRSLGYLAAAKNGLSEDELLNVLSRDGDVMVDFQRRSPKSPEVNKLPGVIWSRLYFDLEPYLTERTADGTTLMTFYHRHLAELVTEDYLAGEARRQRHEALAVYFGRQPLWIEKDGKKTSNLRKVSELPYEQTHGELWDEVEQTLCDLHFIEAKCAAGMTYDLIADYHAALDGLPEAQEDKQKELKHEEQIRKYTEDLVAYARGEIPSLVIIPSVEPWSDEEIKKDTERLLNNPTRLDRIRAFSQFVNSESHGVSKFGSMVSFCLQQAYNSASSGPVAKAAEGIVSTDTDHPLLLQPPSQRPDYNLHPALLRTLEGHTHRVRSVSVTSDGKRAVSGGDDMTLRVWDLESGECLRTLEGHTRSWARGGVTSVSVTPDGKRAVSGAYDKTVRVWDLESGECLRTLKGHRRWVRSVSVTPDGRRAVSGGGMDRTIRVWDIESGECLKTLKYSFALSFESVSVTPDGRRAISGGGDQTVRVWDLESGECLRTLKGHTGPVQSVSVTPDGKRAVSGSWDETVRVWDLESGECLRTLEGHTDQLRSVTIAPDGKRAVSGGRDMALRVWDLEGGKCLRTFEGHTGWVQSVSVTPDGRRAVSGGDDSTLRVWDLERAESLRRLQGHTDYVGIGVTITRVWDLESGRIIRHKTLKGHAAMEVLTVSVTPDGKRAVSGSTDETLQVWDLESGECLRTLEGHTGLITVSVTPDGKRTVSGGRDKTLRVWDLESGECLRTLKVHTRWVQSVSITPDGRRAVSGSLYLIPSPLTRALRVWDLETGKCLRTLKGRTGRVQSVSVTPDGKRAVSGSWDKTVRLWDLEGGKLLRTLKGHRGEGILTVSVTPDGKRAVSGGDDRTLRVWDLESGECLRMLEGHTGVVRSVSVTPDGRRAVSGSTDETLRVWDLESGECIVIYQARSAVTSVSEIRASGHFACGTDMGEVIAFASRNFPMESPIVIPVRMWRYGSSRSGGWWEDRIKATCQWCGQCFPISDEILNVITAIARDTDLSPDQSPCLELPAKAWDEPRLLSECPHCHRPLRFNPFVVDNRGRY